MGQLETLSRIARPGLSTYFGSSGRYLRRVDDLPSPASFTIIGWFYPVSFPGDYAFMTGIESATASASNYLLLGWRNTGAFYVARNGGQFNQFAANPPFGEWLQFALACSGTGAGDAVGYWRRPGGTWNTASVAGQAFTPAVVWLGNDSYDEWADVRMADVRIYNRGLSQTEITREFLPSTSPNQVDLIGGYPLDANDRRLDMVARKRARLESAGALSYRPGPPRSPLNRRRVFVEAAAGVTGQTVTTYFNDIA